MEYTPSTQSKLRVGIICGGQSAEHEVSLQSAKNVITALDTSKYEPVLIGIDRLGGWHALSELGDIVEASSNSTSKTKLLKNLDIIFPVLHGPLGEDGSVQGLMEVMNIPYVGCGVLSSAVGMDKDMMKRLLRSAAIPVTDHMILASGDVYNGAAIVQRFGLPLFVKPANMGSSIGVSKVKTADELSSAIDLAFRYDHKILIEKMVEGDEVECAVLGNAQPQASMPGRLIIKADYYTYAAKYQDGTTEIEIPAKLPKAVTEAVQATALRAYKALGCEGMARVDMFVTRSGEVVVNEINTIPGFTNISMYPMLWQAEGLSYKNLITQLIELAEQRFYRRQQLATQ